MQIRQMKKRFLALLLAATLAVGMDVPVLTARADAPEDGSIVILHTNDVHCSIDQVKKDGKVTNIGYAGVAAYKASMEQEYGSGNVTLVDAGDALQGGSIGTLTKGAAIVDIMNELGYSIAIPGNHAFDYGMENFLSLAKGRAKYTYISSNFTDREGNPVFDTYQILDYGSVKVAYVGITTPESLASSRPVFFQDAAGQYIYGFQGGNNGQDLYNAVQSAVDAAKGEGANYVVAIGHLGGNYVTPEWNAESVIANTEGIDVFIDGHSHEQIEKTVPNKAGKEVVWAQTGSKLAAIGKVVIDTKTNEITNELVKGYADQDEAATAFIRTKQEEFGAELKKVVARSEVDLIATGDGGGNLVRHAETNLGDLCADAYRTILGADVAIVNGGGVRADIAAGDVTYGDIINVHPFCNEACVVETTGQKILDALEFSCRFLPGESGGFLQVSGMTFTVDQSIPSGVVVGDKQEFVKVDGPYRVSNVMINGEPLDLNRTYTLASYDYLLKNGGSGYVMFRDDKLIQDSVILDNVLLINYIVDKLGGNVTAEQYGKPAGRITITDGAANKPENPAQPNDKSPKTGEAAKDETRQADTKQPVIRNTGGIYRVQDGDNLTKIAAKACGNGEKWIAIYEANRDLIADPDLIFTGQVLVIPAA